MILLYQMMLVELLVLINILAHFSSVFTNEDLGSLPDIKSFTVLGPDLIDYVQFTPEVVFMFFIHYLLIKLVDLIFFQPKGAESICVPLSRLFQKSFEVGILPFDWISANVVPVFKCGDRHKPANYRSYLIGC